MKIRIELADHKQFYFVIDGNNGNPVATSKMYKRKYSCRRTARRFGFPVTDNTGKSKVIIKS